MSLCTWYLSLNIVFIICITTTQAITKEKFSLLIIFLVISVRATYHTCIYTMFVYCNLMLFTCDTKDLRVHSRKNCFAGTHLLKDWCVELSTISIGHWDNLFSFCWYMSQRDSSFPFFVLCFQREEFHTFVVEPSKYILRVSQNNHYDIKSLYMHIVSCIFYVSGSFRFGTSLLHDH